MTINPLELPVSPPIEYPESDGEPMAENTEQFNWIVLVKENLESLFADDPHVFVAGDLLWYPVEGQPTIRCAPDTLVAFGRPKGRRGSYRQWEEGGIAPQVVFEILSPSNTAEEMREKREFYATYGVEEYYEYDPDTFTLRGWLRDANGDLVELTTPPRLDGWVSPRLGIQFVSPPDEPITIFKPNGEPFKPLSTLILERDTVQQQLGTLILERDTVQQQLAQERQERERLAALLRSLGVDPDQIA